MNKKILILISVFILIAFIVLYFNGFNSINFKQSSNNGIVGKVMLGPLSPIIREGDKTPNEKLYPEATILIKDSEGRKTIKQFKADEKGEFKINLAPGAYKLEPLTPKGQILPVGIPQVIEVKRDAFTDVIIYYDTGIK